MTRIVSLLGFIFLSCLASPSGSFAQLGRWKVKTISDPDTIKINFDSVVVSSVHEQLKIPIERRLGNKRSETETTVYSITCLLLAFKKARDSDIHLIIQDTITNETMVAEIADPAYVPAKNSLRFVVLQEVRETFDSLYGKPDKVYLYLDPPEKIIISGVGFFDICHGQRAMAPNCREIHPVLSLKKIE